MTPCEKRKVVRFREITLALVLLVVSACTGSDDSAVGSVATTVDAATDCPQRGEPLEKAFLYIEHNATDSDTGVHGFFGGEGWPRLCVWDPDGALLLQMTATGPLGDLGFSDLFFESREPSNEDYSIDDLMTDFPEGEYLVGGVDFEGIDRVATPRFTHAVPAPPTIVTPALAEDEKTSEETTVDPAELVVSWKPVTGTVDGDVVSIVAYQVTVTKEDHDDPDAISQPVYDVHVTPDVSSLPVPPEFLEAGSLYELEVLAIEESGNQTIAAGFFSTAQMG